MNALLKQVLQAHGGLDRWNEFTRVTATIIGGGGLWALKGLEANTTPREMKTSCCVDMTTRLMWQEGFGLPSTSAT